MKIKNFAILLCTFGILFSCNGNQEEEQLDRALFINPPASSQVDTWWHWSGCNISREAIRKDLIAMHDVGIKRATILDVSGSRLEEVPAVEFGSPEWYDSFDYAVRLADSLGMTLGIHNCAGWSTSGGPWITPEKSIKTYTWTKTYVSKGDQGIVLPEPQSNLDYYVDYAVLAYPSHRAVSRFEKELKAARNGDKDVTRIICDGNAKTSTFVPFQGYIDLEFDRPYTASKLCIYDYRVFSWSSLNSFPLKVSVFVSNDGQNYEDLGEYSTTGSNGIREIILPEKTARHFRIQSHIYDSASIAELELIGIDEAPSYKENMLGYLKRLMHVSYHQMKDFEPSYNKEAIAINPDEIINLTECMEPDGSLDWTVPDGDWCILRFGYTTTGVTNSPAMPSGLGLESDKLDKEITDYHFNSFVAKLVEKVNDQVGKGFSFILTDSWECQFPNWTARFPEAFRKKCGYDILKWIPALCDEIVSTDEATDGFIYDFHKTIAELVENNYYKEMMLLSHKCGLEFHSEPIYGGIGPYPPIDIISANQWCDLPMFEFWSNTNEQFKMPEYKIGDRPFGGFPIESAILNGKKIIGSEAYTGIANFSETPQLVTPFGNSAFCTGINQMIMHSYVMQALDPPCQLTLTDYFGGHYNRNTPWFRLAKGWFEYMSRIQYVLQKGEIVTDFLYFIGDQYPQSINESFRSRIPKGYRPNAVNSANLCKSKDYPMLVIPLEAEISENTANVLKALEKKVKLVYEGKDEIAFESAPDFTCSIPDDNFMYTHRKIGNDDIYFIFNQENKHICSEFTFRVKDKVAEIWNPESGDMFKARQSEGTNDGRTSVTLDFKPMQSLFVVFKENSDSQLEPVALEEKEVQNLKAHISFKPYYNEVIADIELEKLKSLTEFENPSIRYFGGEVTYRIHFDLPEGMNKGDRLAINLGTMPTTASIQLNGKKLRHIWHDNSVISTTALEDKDNELIVTVGTSLRNRIAGDYELYGELRSIKTPTQRGNFAKGDSCIVTSGLIGPISIIQYE